MQDVIKQLEDTGTWWAISKGQARKDEPLWACVIREPHIGGSRIAAVEGNDLKSVVADAIFQLKEHAS